MTTAIALAAACLGLMVGQAQAQTAPPIAEIPLNRTGDAYWQQFTARFERPLEAR
jgi:hypothetical protein